MLLSEYTATLAAILDNYSRTDLIVDSSIVTDCRTLKLGIIRGTITFVDGSRLFFSEYLDLRYKTEKLTYSYHYQNQEDELRFRYDNSRHKPDLGFVHHKHLAEGRTIQAEPPDLADLLDEIMDYFL